MTRVTLPRLLRPYWGLCAAALGAMFAESAADLLEPWPLKLVLDHVVSSKPLPPALARWAAALPSKSAVLYAALGAVLLIALIGAMSSYAEKYLTTTIGKRVGYDLRHAVYHHVQRLSLSFYDGRQTGDLLVRLTSDIDAVEDFVTSGVLGIVLDAVTLAGMLVVMFAVDWRFSLIGVAIASTLFLIASRFMRRIKETTRAVRRSASDIASVVQQALTAMRLIKTFSGEEVEEQRLDRQSLAGVEAALRARSVKARLPPVVDVVMAIGTCLVLYFGAHLVFAGAITAGSLVVYVLYLGKMYKPIKDLSKMADTMSKASIAFERIDELLAAERQIADRPGARHIGRVRGRITFEGVRFGYSPSRQVLNGIDLRIEPGQRAAIVGGTGAGKTTLIGLIPRLYEASEGTIRIDGRDVRDVTLRSLRSQISMVLQDASLFRATVADNIAYGRRDATAADILRASRLAHADEFISRLPHGYETVVGERGDTLSGGQRQRIAIARAIIRDTPILLLDEPSSALDPESEDLIFKGLARLLEGRTSITIAHRLATVRHADVIFVLHGGVIAEAGTHRELVARGGRYAKFYALQFHERAESA